MDSEGGLKIISGSSIRNPLNPLQTPSDLLQVFRSSQNKYWELVYDTKTLALTIWPHLEASGKDGEIRVEEAPLRFAKEADLVKRLESHGYARSSSDPSHFTGKERTAQLKSDGKT